MSDVIANFLSRAGVQAAAIARPCNGTSPRTRTLATGTLCLKVSVHDRKVAKLHSSVAPVKGVDSSALLHAWLQGTHGV